MPLNLLKLSPHLQSLDWEAILSKITTNIHLTENKDFFHQNLFFSNRSEIESSLDDIEELSTILQNNEVSLFDYFSQFNTEISFKTIFEKIRKKHILEIFEINNILQLFQFQQNISKSINSKSFGKFLVIQRDDYSIVKKKIFNPIRQFINEDNSINFEKHPELRKLNSAIQEFKFEIVSTLKQSMRHSSWRDIIQNSQYDVIHGRYVISVRSDSFSSKLGLIIDRSNSGLTLHIEPHSIRTLSLKLQEVESQLQSEIFKLLVQYTNIIHEHSFIFYNLFTEIQYLDLLNAKYYSFSNMEFSRPKISTENKIEITKLFHPLLENPIKNDISLNHDSNGMIISGPNTGGKTVILKSIVLCHLFMHMGMFVPCTYASIPIYNGIYFFSNDLQDLLKGLSSFAAEAKNYLQLLNLINGNSLIIIDEIFNSTSSEDASTLAIALIDEIISRSSSKIIISTHHQVLKTFMHTKSDFLSAHMGFDHDTYQPTYKLFTGEPGSSLALAIFQKISQNFHFKTKMIDRIYSLQNSDDLSYENILQDLSQKKGILDKRISEISNQERDLRIKQKNLENHIFLEKKQSIDKFEKQLSTIKNRALKLLSELKSKKAERTFFKKFQSISSEIPSIEKQKELLEDKSLIYHSHLLLKPDQLIQNHNYYCLKINSTITLISTPDRQNQVKVSKGNMKLTCAIDELRMLKKSKKSKELLQANTSSTTPSLSILDLEIDCRGKRLEEFKDIIFNFLLSIENQEVPYINVIHGHGDGVLKGWLRKEIKKHPRMIWNNLEGNDGITQVKLID